MIGDLVPLQEVLIAHQSRGWQLQLTVPMGRAIDEPEVLLQPYDLLELFPVIPRLKERADRAGMLLWRGNSLGYFGPYEGLLAQWMSDQHRTSCGAGPNLIGIEADGTVKGCPSMGTGGPRQALRRRAIRAHCRGDPSANDLKPEGEIR